MNHQYAPKMYRSTQIRTGDYDFDASLAICRNTDVPHRLKLYLASTDPSTFYSYRSGYNAYGAYSGDD